MKLRLYNTLTRKKEGFSPRRKTVSLYACGPTVYNVAHIGNLRTFLFEDILRRTLEYAGYTVHEVMNLTDVGHLTDDADQGEDKMQRQARRERKTAWEIAENYTDVFHQHARALNILAPWKEIRATDTIDEQIRLIQILEKKGYTYTTSDGVYFDTSKVKSYGRLARLNVGGQVEGARVERNVEKREPTDFALWKFSPAGEKRDMEWPSAWGVGFPGWHIECSAMSMSAFNSPTIDIHTGGIDHIPVHHTNEIAQSEAATGKPFVKLWMHGAFLVVGEGARMGKSKGNFLSLDSLVEKGFDPLDYRFFVLLAHYRQTLTFSFEALQSAREGRARLRETIRRLRDYSMNGKNSLIAKRIGLAQAHVEAAISDDLNTPKVLATLFQEAKRLNRAMDSGDPFPTHTALELFAECDRILAVDLCAQEQREVSHDVQKLVHEREVSRKEKNFARADELRCQIEALGWIIKDTPSGPTIIKKV